MSRDQNHDTNVPLREGLVTGLIGAIVVALVYFIIDSARGIPFLTPSVLGDLVLLRPPSVTPSFSSVAVFTVIHLFLFGVFGIVLVGVANLARRNPIARYGVAQLFVALILFSYGFLAVFANSTLGLFPSAVVMIANLAAIAAMSTWLWVQHPSLRWAVRAFPLGAIDAKKERTGPTIVYRF